MRPASTRDRPAGPSHQATGPSTGRGLDSDQVLSTMEAVPSSHLAPAGPRDHAARARLSAALTFAVPLAYGAGCWLVLQHQAAGAHEHGEPPLLLHWLRDSTLALPGVLVAVWLALWLIDRRRGDQRSVPGLARTLLLAAAVAPAASAALAAGSPLHAWLFGAGEEQDLPLLVHLGRDGLVALSAAFPIAASVAALRPCDGITPGPTFLAGKERPVEVTARGYPGGTG